MKGAKKKSSSTVQFEPWDREFVVDFCREFALGIVSNDSYFTTKELIEYIFNRELLCEAIILCRCTETGQYSESGITKRLNMILEGYDKWIDSLRVINESTAAIADEISCIILEDFIGKSDSRRMSRMIDERLKVHQKEPDDSD